MTQGIGFRDINNFDVAWKREKVGKEKQHT